jgi:5-methylcytosine-specific restriction endonuclease McrA
LRTSVAKNQALQTPARRPLDSLARVKLLDDICEGFVQPGASNRALYRIILEVLLPEGAGFPGPVVDQREIREYVELKKPGYRDPFRRMRELQGEEGLLSIIQNGTRYQWVSPAVGEKRIPRIQIPNRIRDEVVASSAYRCSVCSRPVTSEGANRASIDHRVPRTRGGSNEASNYQALCSTCNANKQACCSGCTIDCNSCGWAFPDSYLVPVLDPEILARARNIASARGESPNAYLNRKLLEIIRNEG